MSLPPCQCITIFNPQVPNLRAKGLVFSNKGIQITPISNNLQNQICLLPQNSAFITLNGVAGTKYVRSCYAFYFGRELKDNSTILINAFGLPSVTGSFQQAEQTKNELPSLRDSPHQELPIPLYNNKQIVLIGADFCWTANLKKVKDPPHGFQLIDSRAGLVVGGEGTVNAKHLNYSLSVTDIVLTCTM